MSLTIRRRRSLRFCSVLLSLLLATEAVGPSRAFADDNPITKTDNPDETPGGADLKQTQEVLEKAFNDTQQSHDSGTQAVLSAGMIVAGPYGLALLAAWEAFQLLSGPSENPFKVIGEQLAILQNEIDDLRRQDAAIRQVIVYDENGTRWKNISDLQSEVQKLLDKLGTTHDFPNPDKPRQWDLAGEARDVANRFFGLRDDFTYADGDPFFQNPDPHSPQVQFPRQSLFFWSGLDSQQEFLPPAFGNHPAFETYIAALAAWMHAIDDAYDGTPQAIDKLKNHRDDLERHAKRLSVRRGWDEVTYAKKGGNPGYLPATITENIRWNERCELSADDKYVDGDGNCTFGLICYDPIAGVPSFAAGTPIVVDNAVIGVTPYRFQFYIGGSWNTVCSAPQIDLRYLFESSLEALHGTNVAYDYAELLRRVAATGKTTAPAATGNDPNARFYATDVLHLYAAYPDGRLSWFKNNVERDFHAPPLPLSHLGGKIFNLKGSTKNGTAITGLHGLIPVTATPTPGPLHLPVLKTKTSHRFAATVTSNLLGNAARDLGVVLALGQQRKPGEIFQSWDGPKIVGDGWKQLREVIPAGRGGIYALTQDGELIWYYHDGYDDGSAKLRGRIVVGSGWNQFAKIIPAGNGVLYGITPGGRLLWYKHGDFLDTHGTPGSTGPNVSPTPAGLRWHPSFGSSVRSVAPGNGVDTSGSKYHLGHLPFTEPGVIGNWSGPVEIAATGWDKFAHVFAGGGGTLYGVTSDGQVMWYRHTGFVDGKPGLQGPKLVQSGWTNFKRIFSADVAGGGGYPGPALDIYGIKKTGELMWTRHDGYETGGAIGTWWRLVDAAVGWDKYSYVFAAMEGPPLPPPR